MLYWLLPYSNVNQPWLYIHPLDIYISLLKHLLFLNTICTITGQLPTQVWLFAAPWTAAVLASLSFTISWSLLKLMSIELVMPSNHLILCHPLLFLPSVFPSIRFFSLSLFSSGGQSIGASASVCTLYPQIQTSLISSDFLKQSVT